MGDKRAIYRRTVFDVRSWQDFAVGHVAFTLHRITGWLLLGWIGIHLIVPALRTSPSSVYIPTSTPVIVTLLTVLVFHAFNGVRLLLVELGGLAVRTNRLAFWLTTALSVLFVVVLGVGL